MSRRSSGLSDDRPPARRRGLFDQGLDSLTAIELRDRLSTEFGLELPATIVFENPTIEALSAFLAEAAGPAGGRATIRRRPPGPAVAAADGEPADDAVAVIGMSCRLPGAGSPEEFWSLLTEGRHAVRDLPGRPPGRSDLGGGRGRRPAARGLPRGRGGLRRGVLPGLAARGEVPRPAAPPASRSRVGGAGGRRRSRAARRRPGGSTSASTRRLPAAAQPGPGRRRPLLRHRYDVRGAVGRLSYFLGLSGPSIAIDTACSSSLTAVHLACQSLREGDCEIAVVGGANVIVVPTRIASPGGRRGAPPTGAARLSTTRPTATAAAKARRGRLLKPLGAARRDGDRVYAVIRGSAVNQDGASGGLTVPTRTAQVAVVREARRPGRAGRRATSTTSRRTAPARRSATRSRCARSPRRSAPGAGPTTRCCSARPRPTSATWRRRPASSGC